MGKIHIKNGELNAGFLLLFLYTHSCKVQTLDDVCWLFAESVELVGRTLNYKLNFRHFTWAKNR